MLLQCHQSLGQFLLHRGLRNLQILNLILELSGHVGVFVVIELCAEVADQLVIELGLHHKGLDRLTCLHVHLLKGGDTSGSFRDFIFQPVNLISCILQLAHLLVDDGLELVELVNVLLLDFLVLLLLVVFKTHSLPLNLVQLLDFSVLKLDSIT